MGDETDAAHVPVYDTLSIQDLLEQLGPNERDIASSALITMGETAVGPLTAALSNASWRVAANAAYVLGKIGRAIAVEPLIQAIGRLITEQIAAERSDIIEENEQARASL